MRARRQSRKPKNVEKVWVEWIRKLEDSLPSRRFPLGIGDDAALWRPRTGKDLVLTVDAQVEGTHFRRGWLTPRELGRRAVSASLSDLAAMAGSPGVLLVSMVVDENVSDREFREMYRGIHDASRAYAIPIAGGNISRGPLSITVTALGEVDRRAALRRSGLRKDDEIWVTGAPGLAHLGLLALEKRSSRSGRSPLSRRAIRAFKNPKARLEEARYLSDRWRPTAMIDLSDGLGTDLGHLLESSRRVGRRTLGIRLREEAFSRMEPLAALAAREGLAPVECALRGGDDYELCFAVRPRAAAARAARAFRERHSVPVVRVGQVVATPGLWLERSDGSLEAFQGGGFEHFNP